MDNNEKKNKIIALTAAGAVILLLLAFLIFGKGRQEKSNDVTVVCSFYPVYVLAQNLLDGTGCNVVNMTENLTGCIHDYQMTTKDMKALDGASILMVNGGGMESFLDKVKQNYPKLHVIEVSAAHPEQENPHIWMSTDFEMDCIDFVSTALCDALPDQKDKIRKNAETYGNKIFEGPYKERLDLSDKIEESGRNIRVICFNEAFEVFTDSIGLYNIAVFSLDENETPSAADIAKAIETAKRCDEVVILIEEELAFNADKIVEETGAKLIYIDPLTSGTGADSYVKGMTKNLEAMEDYLK
jgi:zinc transport system substrate-binding protein